MLCILSRNANTKRKGMDDGKHSLPKGDRSIHSRAHCYCGIGYKSTVERKAYSCYCGRYSDTGSDRVSRPAHPSNSTEFLAWLKDRGT